MSYLGDRTLDHLRSLADMPDLDGTRYTIESRLAAGGMGVVYRALDQTLGRPVALKVLKPELSSAANVARLEREARIIAQLEHPGIVPVHDLGMLPDGRMYYVMKLIQGRRLDEMFTPASPLADRLRAFERIAETVAFAHAHGVIHRDLKPQNVMVGAFGEVLVLDWGVAKLLRSAEPEPQPATRAPSPITPDTPDAADVATRTMGTSPGAVIGTPAYMAPEQARGDVAAVDARCDVYALGGILFHLLTGEGPHMSGPGAVAPAARLDAARPAPPRALAAICLKALAEAPTDRYRSADELIDDIRAHLADGRVQAYREPLLARIGRTCWKYRVAIGLIAAYILMRAVLIFWQRI